MGHFKKKKFAQGSNQVNPTGNLRKPFLWKVQLELSLTKKKSKIGRTCKKLFNFEKNDITFAPPVISIYVKFTVNFTVNLTIITNFFGKFTSFNSKFTNLYRFLPIITVNLRKFT